MTIALKAPGRYVQGFGERKNIGKSIKKLGNKFYLIASAGGMQRYGNEIKGYIEAEGKEVVFGEFHGEATKDEVFAHMDCIKENSCDAVIGLGGGKAIDTAKACAENLGGLPLVIVPTVASNDAPCSGVAVLYNEQHVVIKAVMMRRNPDVVIVDTEIIAKSPARYFSAGMGDALATWYEARACRKNHVRTMARGTITETVDMMCRLCNDILMQYGREALEGVKKGEHTEALEKVVEASILMSGIGFESGGLAAAHAVNDGFAQEPQTHGMLHGEKVAFGLLVQMLLGDASEEELQEVLSFIKDVGLPMTLKQLGISEINEENLHKAAEMAVVPTQSTKNLRADITADEVYAAIRKADEIGTAFLAK